jgi:dCMP deaminase
MNMDKMLKFLPDAKAAQGRSKDRSTKVGAVCIDDDYNIRGSGYNGFPRGVNDDH